MPKRKKAPLMYLMVTHFFNSKKSYGSDAEAGNAFYKNLSHDEP